MIALDVLVEEHRIILQVLEALESMVNKALEDDVLDTETAVLTIEFLRTFADHCHHSKEEETLFQVLKRRHLATDVIDLLEEQHREGRTYVHGMESALRQINQGKPGAIGDFADMAGNLISMLRRHIQQEDDGVFPMSQSSMEEGDRRGLWNRFLEIEAGAGSNRHTRGLALADEICRRTQTAEISRAALPNILKELIKD
ncbi:MAG: hemerythrin domain-containing protein [Bacteroidetes bacterium]|nr:hemerythrin domain-containing protein [Bacteroidota bacterium]